MFYMPPAFIVSVPLLIAGGLALIMGGMFVGSQIDDKIEALTNPLPKPLKDLPYWITLPAVIAISYFTIKVAKKWSKKI